MTIEQMVVKAREDHASDIHLICALPPKYRKDGQLENMSDTPLTASTNASSTAGSTWRIAVGSLLEACLILPAENVIFSSPG